MKKSATSFPIIGMIAMLVLGLFLNGCENNPTEPQPNPPGDQLQLSAQAQSVSLSGWQVLNSLNTQDQLSDLVSGGSKITDEEGMLNSVEEIQREEKTMKRIYTFAERSGSFSKITGDSLIWYEEWSLGGTSGRRALYYNDETETARFYEVIFQFPQFVRLEYAAQGYRGDGKPPEMPEKNPEITNASSSNSLTLTPMNSARSGFSRIVVSIRPKGEFTILLRIKTDRATISSVK